MEVPQTSSAPSAVASGAGTAALPRRPALSILAQPGFKAAVSKVRDHFGYTCKEVIPNGYSLLKLPQNMPDYPAAKASRAAVQKQAPTALPSTSNAAHTAAHTARAPARPALATQANTTSSMQKGEDTFDHLMKLVTNSPPATTAVSAAKHGDVDMVHVPITRKTVLVSEAQDRTNALLRPPMPIHLKISMPVLDSLKKIREEMQTMQKKLEQRHKALANQRQAIKTARQTNGTARPTGAEVQPHKPLQSERTETSVPAKRSEPVAPAGVKRAAPSEFMLTVSMNKRIRRGLIDAIKHGSVNPDPFAMDICEEDSALSPSNKRAHKEPMAARADHDKLSREGIERTRSRSTTRQRSREHQRSKERQRSREREIRARSRESRDGNARSRDRGREPAEMIDDLQMPAMAASRQWGSTSSNSSVSMHRTPSASSVTASVSESVGSRNESQLKRQGEWLRDMMRTFKRIGDALKGGNSSECIGYYAESLVCCIECFWSLATIPDSTVKSDEWGTIMPICKFVYKECREKHLGPIAGLAALIMACAYYQLCVNSNHVATTSEKDTDVKKAVADTRKFLHEMTRWENISRQMLTAEVLSRDFPKTWRNCLVHMNTLDQFELRSRSNTERWPAIAYPISSTSNPLDISNFLRQVNREWLESQRLSLKMPDIVSDF